MRNVFLIMGLVGLIPAALCAQIPSAEEAIRQVLEQQVEAWNQGDIEGFMEGYLESDSTRFASGNTVYYGWKEVLNRYRQRYATPEAMGILTFSDLDIRVLSDQYALVFGRWSLQRKEDRPSGLFTLLFVRTSRGWRIVHDHTSSGS